MNVGFGTVSFGIRYSKADSFAVLDKYVVLGGRCVVLQAFWEQISAESPS